MPVVVSPAVRRWRQVLLALPLLLLGVAGLLHEPDALLDESCLRTSGGLSVCAASDMARITRQGISRLEHPRFDLRSDNPDRLHWTVARNETIAFQLILRTEDRDDTSHVTLDVADSAIRTSLYQAHYLQVRNGGYRWGPKTAVLPYPAAYPDALIPRQHRCAQTETTLFDQIALPRAGRNQSVWVEMYIPDDLTPGDYQQHLRLIPSANDSKQILSSDAFDLQVSLTVIDATLPHRPSIDAVGEIYRSYRLEGVGEERSSTRWQEMAQCYQVMAHQHRMVFIERNPEEPQGPAQWQDYLDTYAPILDGQLFSREAGYTGTGRDTAVSVWRTPWPQEHDVIVEAALSDQQLQAYTQMAGRWSRIVRQNHWLDTRYFAYAFDEVDGPVPQAETDPDRHRYIARVHGDMAAIQQAIDRGTSAASDPATPPIDLLWTSHSDPTIWLDDPDTTLTGRVRLWAPNAHAANTDFLQDRMAMGERSWFYHSGHPAVGGHSINLPGSDMRSWGVIGARYGIQGQLMWSVNLGSDELPFAQPSYKPDDDRVGNGVMVYPGFQLPRIGYPAAAGPIPSMRLKAWHRGLQDAELYFLAHQRHPEAAQALINALIPRALGEAVASGENRPAWPRDAASWIQWRDDLLELLQRH
ncbi:glycoside hydrolase domain-containing protein [Granulosicoccus sp. 3-233]|uniref:glycoside hydrolase domain-containing protein n=1 Tax=Granulosicoccus sp. 3-233 TaxID=3417969 RepID=UPI003D34ADF6